MTFAGGDEVSVMLKELKVLRLDAQLAAEGVVAIRERLPDFVAEQARVQVDGLRMRR